MNYLQVMEMPVSELFFLTCFVLDLNATKEKQIKKWQTQR